MRKKWVLLAAAGAILVAGCSSKPRNFAPVLSIAPVSEDAYQAQWMACREQVIAAANGRSERAVSAAGGAAAGAGASVAVGAAASGTYATMGSAMAALGATIVAAPIAAVGGAWGISKMKKTRQERATKKATAECLAQRGYSVADWRVLSKRELMALQSPSAQSQSAVEKGRP